MECTCYFKAAVSHVYFAHPVLLATVAAGVLDCDTVDDDLHPRSDVTSDAIAILIICVSGLFVRDICVG